jgi:hypothetical protein
VISQIRTNGKYQQFFFYHSHTLLDSLKQKDLLKSGKQSNIVNT